MREWEDEEVTCSREGDVKQSPRFDALIRAQLLESVWTDEFVIARGIGDGIAPSCSCPRSLTSRVFPSAWES